jgi:undecaprenyl diphosphate synthase
VSESETLLPVPVHVGIIMDGNGRWAKSRGLPRSAGHQEGLKSAKKIVFEARRLGVRWLSLFVFSTENWKRAESEVIFLMGLIRGHLRDELEFYRDNGIRIQHSGDKSGLPREVRADIESIVEETSGLDSMTVNLAINYGGKDEILRAIRKIPAGTDPALIDQAAFETLLDVPLMPDMDLIIRTAGEMRLSNFFLWKSAYAEYLSMEKLWPDFLEADFDAAIDRYRRRERRFGGVK